MPIVIRGDFHSATRACIGESSFRVMEAAFRVHERYGRFVNETVFKKAVAMERSGVQLEVPVDVTFESFQKTYYLDMVADDCCILEWKAADSLCDQHRGQLLNYLYLTGALSGKLVNTRPERIEHEFVNASVSAEERHTFRVDRPSSSQSSGSRRIWMDCFLDALADWGTGLSLSLYEEAIEHFSSARVEKRPILSGDTKLGSQSIRVLPDNTAIKVTSLPERAMNTFGQHARRLLLHTNVSAVRWINIRHHAVTCQTIRH
ncbi:MAG: GxxExxY protein [Planctomycetota bacterium]